MADFSDFELGKSARRLRVDTLARLRWLAIFGQLAAICFTEFALKFSLPLVWCLAVIAASALFNLGQKFFAAPTLRLADGPAAAQLAFDILQLSALLYLTGGLENPFAVLFLAPVAIAAMSLPPRKIAYLGLLTAAAATVLGFEHRPLPWFPGEAISLPQLYQAGVWTAILVSSGFICVYAARVAAEARALTDALSETELVLQREKHLSLLDGLAAAAAHELGTPLATIALVIKEMKKTASMPAGLAEDLELLSQESQRCRAILGRLKSLDKDTGGLLENLPLSVLLENVAAPHRNFGVSLVIVADGTGPEPRAPVGPGVVYGLGNLIENAVDFAKSEVEIVARWDAEKIEIVVSDDGPGFSPEVLPRIGDPYVTTRVGRRAKNEEGSGLGLGLFIAKTLLERSGATVTIANSALSGARVAIFWPRERFERPAPQ